MVNVLFITNVLETGGAERYFVKCENQISNNHINLFTAAKKGSFVRHLKYHENFTELSSNYLKNLVHMYFIVKRKRINLIHANSFTMLLYCLILKCMFPRVKLIYTKHNVTVIERYTPRIFAMIINLFVTKVITVYEQQRQILINQGIQEKKTFRIYNGVDLDQFKFSEKLNDNKTVGILGRLSPEKNHALFLKAAKLIISSGYPYTFLIAGDGPEKLNIINLIEKLELEDHVKLLGNINSPETFLKSIDVMVLTSTTEAFPMTILESFAVGVPVISINVGGINEIIRDYETGRLIDNYCEKEFADGIINILSNKDTTVAMKKVARKLVEKSFNSQIMIHETQKVYLGNT